MTTTEPVVGWRTWIAAMALGALAGCGPTVAPAPAGTLAPPPPLALVVIVDPSPGQAAPELAQLAAVIQAGVPPSSAVVVSLLAAAPAVRTRVVRAGESLSVIAGAEGVSLAALQDANPQLGPLAHRDWNRVYPGDRVTVPGAGAGSPARYAVVTRAPPGPRPPALVRAPERPANATPFQDAQYRRALAAADSANQRRAAAWRAEAVTALGPWQARLLQQLGELASGLEAGGPANAVDADAVAASVQAAANTLDGLPGRRVLLLLAGARIGDAQVAAGPSLASIHLVVANLPAASGASFTAAASGAGAAVTALDPALTELELAAAVDG